MGDVGRCLGACISVAFLRQSLIANQGCGDPLSWPLTRHGKIIRPNRLLEFHLDLF